MAFCGLQSDKWILLYRKHCPILYRTALMIFLPVLQADIYTKMWCFHWMSFLCNAIRNAQCRDCTLQHGEQTANTDLLLNQTAHTKHWITKLYLMHIYLYSIGSILAEDYCSVLSLHSPQMFLMTGTTSWSLNAQQLQKVRSHCQPTQADSLRTGIVETVSCYPHRTLNPPDESLHLLKYVGRKCIILTSTLLWVNACTVMWYSALHLYK